MQQFGMHEMSTFKQPPKLLLVALPMLPEEALLPPDKLPDSWLSSRKRHAPGVFRKAPEVV